MIVSQVTLTNVQRGCNLNIFSLPSHFGQFQKALLFYNQFFYGSPFPVFKACRFRFLRATRISRFFRPFSILPRRRDAERQALKIDVLYTSSREYRSKRLCVCVQPERRRSIGLYKRSVDFKCAWNPLSVVSRQRLESNNGWPHTCVHNSDKLLSSLLAW
jgi:hypothetical protein